MTNRTFEWLLARMADTVLQQIGGSNERATARWTSVPSIAGMYFTMSIQTGLIRKANGTRRTFVGLQRAMNPLVCAQMMTHRKQTATLITFVGFLTCKCAIFMVNLEKVFYRGFYQSVYDDAPSVDRIAGMIYCIWCIGMIYRRS